MGLRDLADDVKNVFGRGPEEATDAEVRQAVESVEG